LLPEAELKECARCCAPALSETFDASIILDTSTEIEELGPMPIWRLQSCAEFADDACTWRWPPFTGVRLVVSWNFKHLVNVRRETRSTP